MREKKRKTAKNDEKADIHEQDRQRKERGQECWLASNWIPSIYHSPPLALRSVDSLLRFGTTANKNRVLSPSPWYLPPSLLFYSRPFFRHRFYIHESNSQNDWIEFLGETLIYSYQFADVCRYKLYIWGKNFSTFSEDNYRPFIIIKLIN